jgi:hypothetical protein
VVVVVVVTAMLAGCQTMERPSAVEPEPVPHVVTADIQAGIERHVQEQTRLGGGYFTIPYEGAELRLKLVRVHTEYLANLGPRSHFACVDLANTDGNVYDVDFFLEGDPGSMRVTETIVHKLNGQPFYLWEQRRMAPGSAHPSPRPRTRCWGSWEAEIPSSSCTRRRCRSSATAPACGYRFPPAMHTRRSS